MGEVYVKAGGASNIHHGDHSEAVFHFYLPATVEGGRVLCGLDVKLTTSPDKQYCVIPMDEFSLRDVVRSRVDDEVEQTKS
jgi:hypothetical protein